MPQDSSLDSSEVVSSESTSTLLLLLSPLTNSLLLFLFSLATVDLSFDESMIGGEINIGLNDESMMGGGIIIGFDFEVDRFCLLHQSLLAF